MGITVSNMAMTLIIWLHPDHVVLRNIRRSLMKEC